MKSLTDLQTTYTNAVTFTFGDGPELCHRLLSFVRAGKKTATCGAAVDFDNGVEAMPVVGRCDIALEWDGTPALVIKTTKVTRVRYCDVTEAMALKEGENDSLAGWQRDHEDYFTRNGGFDPQMALIFEEFELVEDLSPKRP
ncbi:MAG: ASCH domain-containing protein [Pseudomonadota bacterium]